jgi:HK97 family phage portal protein
MAFSIRKLFSFSRGPVQIAGARRYLPGSAGIFVDEDVAMSVSAFHRGVTYISTQLAKLPWEIKDKNNDVKEGSLMNLLDLAPNPEMNTFTFRTWLVSQALQHGNSFSEIQRNASGTAIALWPLPTKSVDLFRNGNGELVYRVAGASATVPGEDAYLPARDVFHCRNFHTKDGLIGQGLIAYASETIGIAKAADRMAAGIFNNAGIPSGVLKVKGRLSDEAYKRLEESWKAQNGGRKAGGIAILEEETDFSALNLDPDVLQFLESRKFSVLELARFFGLPPTKLFDASTATYSNVENANLEVATDTLDAWAVNLELEADVKILNNRYGGTYTELNLYAVFRGDMKTRSDYFKALMSVGAITPNQIRKLEGMPGYGKDGDKYFIATNNYTPSDRLDEVIDSQIKSKEQKDVTPPNDQSEADKEEQRKLTAAALKILERQ